MRTLITIFILALIMGINAYSQTPNYYWDGDIKRIIESDTSILLLEVSANNVSQISKLISDSGDFPSRTKKDGKSQYIFTYDSQIHKSINKEYSSKIISSIREKGKSQYGFITDEISVMLKSDSDAAYLSKKYNLDIIEKTPYGSYLLRINNPTKTLSIANTIKESENVIWSCPNFVNLIQRFTTDPLYPNQYYLNNTGQGGGTNNIDINAPEAWNITLGCQIRVAVIDDGVENHDDFNGRVLGGFTAGAVNTGGAPRNDCTKGHGVACAGIIAASHNTIGISGIAPNSLIIPINIFPNAPSYTPNFYSGAATPAELATAINWAWRADQGNAHVLSNSWGGGLPNPDVTREIGLARTSGRGGLGAIVVFASGNNGTDVIYPGYLDGVITVGAINRNGNIQAYSSTGPSMDLVAPSGGLGDLVGLCIVPGGDVETTDRMNANGYGVGNYTNSFGGTSAACPQVSGVAALMLSVNPNLTETEVRTKLQQTATNMGTSGFDNTFGYGRLDAYAAVTSALPSSISGSAHVCPNGTYSISNLPVGSTVSWSSSNTNAVTINSSGVATRVGGYNGSVAIKALITRSTGCSMTLSKIITVGSPAIINVFVDRTGCIGNVDYINATVVGHVGTANWSKTGSNSSNAFLNNYGNGSASFSTNVPDCYNLTLIASNSCGTSSNGLTLCASNCSFATYKVYPNPADDYVSIEFEHVETIESLPHKINLYSEKSIDAVKTVYVKDIFDSKSFKNGNKIEMYIKDLPRGVYFLHIIPNNNSSQKTDKIRILLK